MAMLLIPRISNKFSPLQDKNKPCDGELEHLFILGSLECTIANNMYNYKNKVYC
jgi:hypothetical protein